MQLRIGYTKYRIYLLIFAGTMKYFFMSWSAVDNFARRKFFGLSGKWRHLHMTMLEWVHNFLENSTVFKDGFYYVRKYVRWKEPEPVQLLLLGDIFIYMWHSAHKRFSSFPPFLNE